MIPLAATMVTMTLIVCSAAPCTPQTAKQIFTEQMSRKACGIYISTYGKNPQYDANYARNRFKYVAVAGDVFVATCSTPTQGKTK